MGIGNISDVEQAKRYVQSHYPSWGWELVAVSGDHRRHTGLITPHGDWEPVGRDRWYAGPAPHYPSWGLGTPQVGLVNARLPRLIAPHGDWELVQKAKEIEDQLASLPLMGIGNHFEQGDCPYTDQVSLPLMGIGNLKTRPTIAANRITHYPSWGLGTSSAAKGMRPGELSLPLMGIGNERGQHPHPNSASTHYPSWGLGTLVLIVFLLMDGL